MGSILSLKMQLHMKNAMRAELLPAQCDLTHVWFTTSFNDFLVYNILYLISFCSLYDKRSHTEIQDMKVRMDDSRLTMFSFDIGQRHTVVHLGFPFKYIYFFEKFSFTLR